MGSVRIRNYNLATRIRVAVNANHKEKGQKMNRTFKATVTLNKTQLAELIIWAVKNKCSGGLTFGANFDDDTARMAVSVAEARGAIAATADLPPQKGRAAKARVMRHNQFRKAAGDSRYILDSLGRVDIDASCRAIGLSRKEIMETGWKGGSTEHRVKCAIQKESRHPARSKPLVRTASGTIDIEESLLSLGLSRATLLRKRWKRGSNQHKLKAAIRCGWKEALKAKNAHAYRDSNGKRDRDMGPTYSTNGNLMGKAGMEEKGLKDLSQVV